MLPEVGDVWVRLKGKGGAQEGTCTIDSEAGDHGLVRNMAMSSGCSIALPGKGVVCKSERQQSPYHRETDKPWRAWASFSIQWCIIKGF